MAKSAKNDQKFPLLLSLELNKGFFRFRRDSRLCFNLQFFSHSNIKKTLSFVPKSNNLKLEESSKAFFQGKS